MNVNDGVYSECMFDSLYIWWRIDRILANLADITAALADVSRSESFRCRVPHMKLIILGNG